MLDADRYAPRTAARGASAVNGTRRTHRQPERQRWAALMSCTVVALCWTTAAPAWANVVRGVVRLSPGALEEARTPIQAFWRIPNGSLAIAPPQVGWRDETLVVLESEHPIGAPGTVDLTMVDARFVPPVVFVQEGGSVRFVNHDTVLHLLEPIEGAFMASESVGPGESATHAFDKAGVYRLRCSEVTHMKAVVLVLQYGQATTLDGSGSFRFANVPSGVHTLRVWFRSDWAFQQSIDARNKPVFVEATLRAAAAK